MPERRVKPATVKDACRVHGSLTLNKVAGNFHVTAGKVLPIAGAHAHMTGFMDRSDYNFSHRIEKLSFGENHAGIIQPLEGDEKITDISKIIFTAPAFTFTNCFGRFRQYAVFHRDRSYRNNGFHGSEDNISV